MKRLFCCLFIVFSLGEPGPHLFGKTIEGSWAFSLPDRYPAWLKVSPDGSAQLLWSIGHPHKVEVLKLSDREIVLQRDFGWKLFGRPPELRVRTPIRAYLTDDDVLILSVLNESVDGEMKLLLEGKRMPSVPPAPDLSQVRFGQPIDLIGLGMEAWKLTDSSKENGWRIEDGLLINESTKRDHGGYGDFGNIQTVGKWMDFELSIDYKLPEGGNSGVYLRGAYEVQVLNRGDGTTRPNGVGSVYGRISAKENAAHPQGEWNSYKITLVDRHITVVLNGVKVIDNQPLEGCTGGGINGDDTVPGPLFLQGDHTSVIYRNIILRPVL